MQAITALYLLLLPSLHAERGSHAGQGQLPSALPTATVLGVAVIPGDASTSEPAADVTTARASSSQLHIEASIAQYPFVTGQPVRYPAADANNQGGLVFVPDLPNTQQLWQSQKTLMLAWLATSIMSLIIFAPFYITTGLFLGAEIAAILGITASATHLCRRHADDGECILYQEPEEVVAYCIMLGSCKHAIGDSLVEVQRAVDPSMSRSADKHAN